jgi:hypothetical protein
MPGYRLHKQDIFHLGHHCENGLNTGTVSIPVSRHLRIFSASRFTWEVRRMASAEFGVVVITRRDRRVDVGIAQII